MFHIFVKYYVAAFQTVAQMSPSNFPLSPVNADLCSPNEWMQKGPAPLDGRFRGSRETSGQVSALAGSRNRSLLRRVGPFRGLLRRQVYAGRDDRTPYLHAYWKRLRCRGY